MGIDVREIVEKSHDSLFGGDVDTAGAIQDPGHKEARAVLSESGGIKPPYDPGKLIRAWENSGALNPNIQAYVTNIDGLGHQLEPVIDLESDEAWDQVREAMWLERLHAEGGGEVPDNADALQPSKQEVDDKVRELDRRARLERLRLESFLNAASPEGSFVTLRRETRQDREVTGNAYWEVLRNKRGEIARFVRVEPAHVRATKKDDTPQMVDDRVPFGPIGWDTVKQKRFFRRYVQAVGSSAVWFKEFGDPRVVSRKTGAVYESLYQFQQEAERGDEPATELIHFRTYATGSPYGIPRWIGHLLAVLGSHAADEVNYMYFDNKAVPPLAILVSGGHLSDDDVNRIEARIRERIQGRENYHSVLLVQATKDPNDASPTTPSVQIQDLSNAQEGDALFQKYDERNIDKIGQSFRMPRLVRGDVNEVNRASAHASLRFSDEQVFEPERQEFDSWMNRAVLPELGIRLWRFRSNGPQTRDPETLSKIVGQGLQQGAITPNEARPVYSSILGHELPKREEAWADQPMQLVLSGFAPATEDEPAGFGDAEGDADGEGDEDTARVLRELAAKGRRQIVRQGGSPDGADEAGLRALGEVYGGEDDDTERGAA